MRLCLLLSLIALSLASVALAAPPGPLVAGTAPGDNGSLSQQFYLGIHYPDNVTVLYTMPPVAPPPMPNYTAPYDEWADSALVSGRRPAMTSDIVIMTSKRRGSPHTSH